MEHDLSIFFSMKSIIIFILVMSRISGMLSTAPLFSTFPIPLQLKIGLTGLVSFLIYPFVLQTSTCPMPQDLIMLSAMTFKELFIGILIGFCAQLIFIGIEIGGQLLSMQMGLAIAEALDPVTRQQVPVIGQFYLYVASLVFIFMNGHHWLFSGVYSSYKTLPIGLNFDFTAGVAEKIIFFTSQIFYIAFSVIMPIFAFLLIIDIALGFISKMMPQMNIFMVSLPLKIYVGLVFMSLFMPSTAVYLSTLMGNFLDNLRSIFS